MTIPVQEFQIGQRVRSYGQKPFIIRLIYCSFNKQPMYGEGSGGPCFAASELTLAPERPPYVPSERVVIRRLEAFARFAAPTPECYRCETDAEMAERHAIERAEYDAQGGGE